MQKASKVVVVVFDGLRPDMVTAALMPRLHAFAGANLWFREARSVFPSMTRVATSSVSTGANPSVHGIVGNAFYYPEVTTDFVLDTASASDIALAEARIGGRFLTAPTFGDVLAANGKSFSVVHSGSPGSTYAINPGAAENAHWTFSVHGEDHTRTPHAVREAVAAIGPLPETTLPRFDEIAYSERVFRELVLGQQDPDVALIWFSEPDTSFHYKFLGSSDTIAIMKHADAAFGRILDAIAERADADEVAVLAVSDHGQISSSAQIDIAGLLTAAGHPTAKAAARDLAGAKLALTGGNMGEIRCLDGDMARREAVAKWLMQQDFIGMVFTPSSDPVIGSIEGTFSLDFVGLQHARAPELVYILKSDETADPYGLPGLGLITGGVPVGGGMHGGLNRHEINTLLVVGGAAATGQAEVSSLPAGLIDIAPTILDLMGLAAPASMQGQSLLPRELRKAKVATDTYETGANGFRQRVTIARRGENGPRFVQHGGRIG